MHHEDEYKTHGTNLCSYTSVKHTKASNNRADDCGLSILSKQRNNK